MGTPAPPSKPRAPQAAPRGRARPRGGRGGKGGVGSYKIAGIELPYDPDLEFDKPTPEPLFPTYHPTKPKPLSKEERIQVARFRSLRNNIYEGPLYTILGDNARIGKTGNSSSSAALFDPFEGMPTYSQKYTKKRRRIPKLDTRPYVLKFFPKDLWPILDPSCIPNGTSSPLSPHTHKKSKTLQLASLSKTDTLKEFDDEISGDNNEDVTATAKSNGAQRNNVNGEGEVDEDEVPEEVVDDEYDEDEDEGGDYNAEQYFDDGGDDAGDDYDGGEGDGGDYY